ncbi:DegT/DnrJ/EryC1/StrS family aminotransferase [Fictibacillus sp. 18YEL24]|uniref:DegT/DnrJ/EryC1/StrS family aminotransferase n=1 Tax=Fictibacillus sp. 18YEL24 TaxID=2745875 RepID=UPI0018CCFA9F|nr:DegT/DnrJ/EryC1/StrS family aminotransferase [Fictibacillus sp. 18YEL24]MBH0169360.1 DegT/DnrJ/EryC1/StrS family aminotransferase [Fictibacillus sp. 18YEL24]
MKESTKPILVTKPFLPPMEEYVAQIKEIWNNAWLTNNGPLHNSLENKLKDLLGGEEATLYTNGTLALESALQSIGVKGEIITTPFTFAATVHAIVRTGNKPVFCDIEPSTFNIDVNKIEELVTDQTIAILPVHVFGFPCDVYKINEIAQKHQLKVIYDAAHAFGVQLNNIPIGAFGDISMFSFHATKVFHSIEGGLLSYNGKELQRKLNLLKNFGYMDPENIEIVGTNAKMNEFQAAMGLVNLKHINEEIKKRERVVNFYKSQLNQINGIKYIEDRIEVKQNHSYFPILVEESFGIDRNRLQEELALHNIQTRKYFYPLCSDFSCYQDLVSAKGLSVAREIANKVLVLPLYGTLTEEEVTFICHKIKEIKIVSEYVL